MRSRLRRRRLTSAHVIAFAALFVALGGTSFARDGARSAVRLITGAQVKDNSLTGADVRDHSLRAKDFRAGDLPAGATGAKGDIGAIGTTGATGATGAQGPSGAGYTIGSGLTLNGDVLAALTGSTAGTVAAGDDPRLSDARAPAGAAGGDLQGTYPAPTLKSDSVTGAEVQNGTLDTSDLDSSRGTAVVDPPDITAGTCEVVSTAVPIMQAGDTPFIALSSLPSDASVVEAMTSTAGTLRVRVCNHSAVDDDSSAFTLSYVILR